MNDLAKIADALERDRREPDKVLLYVSDIRRVESDQARMAHLRDDQALDVRLFYTLQGYGIDDTVAGHLVNEIRGLYETPDRTPHGLELCKVCRAPLRQREPVPEPEPKAKAAKQ